GFTSIDGVSYVNNEYLEGQEFNLEGKKRFYTMPDGSGRLETIERKKGVSRSMIDRIMSRPIESSKAITLSTNYVRLTPEDLALAFEEDRCFVENYTKSIKKLS
ncbi:putative pilus assembly protein FilE, partial [Acinetobacter ursingii]